MAKDKLIEERSDLATIVDNAIRDWQDRRYACNEEGLVAVKERLAESIAAAVLANGYHRQVEGEWVSVEEDGLPREDGEYLTFNGIVYFLLEFNSSLQLWNVSAWDISTAIRDVTHWMPLPKPPKMKGADDEQRED